MDPRLRAAVDTSRAWYDDIFALHAIPTRVDGGLWWALSPPPRWHSGVKTTEPGVAVDRVLAVHRHGAVADSFGDLELASHGFTVLLDASWTHHPALEHSPAALPAGWTVVRDAGLLAEWNRAHDYADVLPAEVLDRRAFTVLAHHVGGDLVGGAIVHRGHHRGVVGLSNTWSSTPAELDHGDLLAVVAATDPGSAVTAFGQGADLSAMLRAGYVSLGPQRVWARQRA